MYRLCVTDPLERRESKAVAERLILYMDYRIQFQFQNCRGFESFVNLSIYHKDYLSLRLSTKIIYHSISKIIHL